MIYTITLNPSIDFYIYLNDLKVGSINRSQAHEFVAAGKGINVSKMLSIFHTPSVCIFPKGGFSGEFLEEELNKDKYIKLRTVEIEGQNRINVKVRHQQETDINTSGPKLSEKEQEGLLELLNDVETDDTVVISGTVQNDLIDFVKKIADGVNQKKGKVVLDVPNLNLKQIIECQPYLIKPNKEELINLFENKYSFKETIEKVKEIVNKSQIKSLLISLGEDGAMYLDSSKQFTVKAPKVEVVNTVGAGDSMLATMVGCLQKGKSVEESMKFAVACGSGCVASKTLPTIEEIEHIVKEVIVE